jgi:4-amino-4-deoxy-L-arabinose transferase-like glycosyltransferase
MTTTTPFGRLRPRAQSRPQESGSPAPGRSFAARIVRGAADDPAWARPSLLGLLAIATVLYVWDLSASGYANSFYAAAAQAGSVSWKAWFFGAFDAGSFITVDKPPASMWVMGLSGRIFGFSSWSMLVPQALEGVAAVGLVHAAVKRWSGPVAGLLAGAALMLTPAAVLIFRFNNPDALLVLLLVAAAYCMIRALESAGTGWLLLAGSAIGFAFLAKMMQAFLVVPALGLVYLVCAPTPLRRRLLQLLAGLAAVVVSAGWWIAIVELTPASSRPYIGGSTNNNILELVLGYNGLGRIFGGDGNGGGGGGGGGGGQGGPGGGAAGSSFGGATGLGRLFGSEMGNEISWLLPAALIALVAGLIVTRRAPRTDRARAGLILWGGWVVVTGLTFSYMKGTIHPYYTVALAPGVAALVAVGGHTLWQHRAQWPARLGSAAMVLATGFWSYTLLARNSDWHPELRYLILAGSVLVTLGLLIPWPRPTERVRTALTLVGALVALIGTSAYAVPTAASAHTGSIPSVGPSSAQTSGFGGGGTGAGSGRNRGEFGGGFEGGTGGRSPGGVPGGEQAGGGFGGGPAAEGSTTNPALTALLEQAGTRWAAATIGSGTAASLQLASGRAVMSIGGFNGGDPAPTLAQFKAYVAAGQVRYFVSGGAGGGPGGGRGNSEISTWVAGNYTATTIGGQSVYDLKK